VILNLDFKVTGLLYRCPRRIVCTADAPSLCNSQVHIRKDMRQNESLTFQAAVTLTFDLVTRQFLLTWVTFPETWNVVLCSVFELTVGTVGWRFSLVI